MIISKIFNESPNNLATPPEFIRLASMLAFISLIYAFPVITTERLYIDDLRRSILGIAEWEGVGRPMASILMALINFQYPDFDSLRIIDLSPLPQVMALGLLVIAAACLSFSINGNKASWLSALSVFPIIGSPFFSGKSILSLRFLTHGCIHGIRDHLSLASAEQMAWYPPWLHGCRASMRSVSALSQCFFGNNIARIDYPTG